MPLQIIIPGLIIIGFILILIEIFLVPGFNIFGIFGFILVVLGIVFAYTKLQLWWANFIMAASLALSLVLIWGVVKSKSWRRIVLDVRQEKVQGFHVSSDNLAQLIGKKGVAYTKLRPAGIALIEDQKVDVMTEGGFIEKDQAVEVIQVEGNRVVVREISS